MPLPDRLIEARLSAKLPPRAAAIATGLDPRLLDEAERGRATLAEAELCDLAAAYRVPAAAFVGAQAPALSREPFGDPWGGPGPDGMEPTILIADKPAPDVATLLGLPGYALVFRDAGIVSVADLEARLADPGWRNSVFRGHCHEALARHRATRPALFRAWLSRSWGCWVQSGTPCATEEECRRQTEAEWQSDYGWECRAVLGVDEDPQEVFG